MELAAAQHQQNTSSGGSAGSTAPSEQSLPACDVIAVRAV